VSSCRPQENEADPRVGRGDPPRAWSEHILALKRSDPEGVMLTNQGGWHSRTNLLEDPELNALFLWIASCTQKARFEPICIPTACSAA
jgi:hypothetical protein